jgi:cobalt-zinc-cadmium resistance protein CzcA
MALTFLFALLGSLVLSLTFMPAMASVVLPRRMQQHENALMRGLKLLYRPCVGWVMTHPRTTVGVALLVLLASLPVALRLGGEFMPRLKEGDLLIEVVRLPSASLEGAIEMCQRIETTLRSFPEVKTVFSKTGRPEIANDVMGVHQTDVWVILHDRHDWKPRRSRDALINQLSEALSHEITGATIGFTQPIEMRVDELVAGVKSDVAVQIYGDDLQVLTQTAKEIEGILSRIPGAADVKADSQANLSAVTITPRRDTMARHGISPEQVVAVIRAVGGHPVGWIFEQRARFPVVVRFPEAWRGEMSRLGQLPVGSSLGELIPLAEIADLQLQETPPSIEHEATRRRISVAANVRGRDVASFVREAQARIAAEVTLPSGMEIRWGGDFQHLQSATRRLLIISPIVLLLIFLLLQTSFQSMSLALLIFLAVPMAASGGLFALALRGLPFSISAGVGFIALFGVAVLNGLVWVSAAEQLLREGVPMTTTIHRTALSRLRPVLMTALVASLGFVPMAISDGDGAELQRPLATVVIGGLLTATLLTLLVIPAIYPWFATQEPKTENPTVS